MKYCYRFKVNSYFERIINENDDDEEQLQVNISQLQDICFFLKTFCSEAEENVNLLKNGASDENATVDIEEKVEIKDSGGEQLNLNGEPETPEDLNQILPYECYRDVFTYTTVDLSKCKQNIMRFIPFEIYFNNIPRYN